MTEYHRRCVLRWAVTELRTPTSNVEATSLAAGFSSRTSLYEVLATRTGIRPGAVRSLTDEQFGNLLDGPLALPSRYGFGESNGKTGTGALSVSPSALRLSSRHAS
jgi:hypothetical protein